MKKQFIFLPFFVVAFLMLHTACTPKCDTSLKVTLGKPYFTVQYINGNGVNLLKDAWNPANISVYVDTTGGKNTAASKPITPGYKADKTAFGPFEYTDSYINPASQEPEWNKVLGREITYDYHIRKDTAGTDILRVKYTVMANECAHIWKAVDYYRAKNVLPNVKPKFDTLFDYHNNDHADIIVIE